MSAWTLVPCLVALRDEFNELSPRRDKGADGSIGDSAHTSSSDHTPDEDSDALRDHDPDNKNEVHAFDCDSTGPWPESFDTIIKRLVAREKAEYQSATTVGRLKYVIWNRRIAERSNGWAWRSYTLSDPHTNHAHFSARYTTAQENDTRSWGVHTSAAPQKEIDVPIGTDKIKLTSGAATALGPQYKPGQEIDGETALNLLLIWAARGGVNSGNAVAGNAVLRDGQADLAGRVKAIEDWFAAAGAPGAPEQKAALLHAVLGAESKSIGLILAAYED